MTEPPTEKPSTADEQLMFDPSEGIKASADASQQEAAHPHAQPSYLTGWRLHSLTLALFVGTFLVNLEISILSTPLVSITNDLKHFSQSSWVIAACLLTYTSFMIVLAKLSDVVGQKTVLLSSIICRAFQGIGGCGVYSLTMAILVEMASARKWPLYLVLMTSVFACSMILGPIFGGLINVQSDWMWVFLLNVPGGVFAVALVVVALPANFPYHDRQLPREPLSLRRTDFPGAFLLLAAMTLYTMGFEQAATLFEWTSAEVLPLLLVSALFWVAFFASQWYATQPQRRLEPLFPWRFCQSRVIMGIIASRLAADQLYLPVACSPDNPGWNGLYGIEVVTGIGIGITIGVVTLMIPYATENRGRATGTSSVMQFRFMGGATTLAIVTAVANNWLQDILPTIVPPEQVALIFRDPAFIDSLADEAQRTVRGLFVESFNLQMRILIGFPAAQFPVTMLMWQRKPMYFE